MRSNTIFPHEPGNTVLTAGFSGLPQVQEHPRGTVNVLTGLERSPDQAQRAGILFVWTLCSTLLALMNSYLRRTALDPVVLDALCLEPFDRLS